MRKRVRHCIIMPHYTVSGLTKWGISVLVKLTDRNKTNDRLPQTLHRLHQVFHHKASHKRCLVFKYTILFWTKAFITQSTFKLCDSGIISKTVLTLILRRSRTGTVWFYTSTSNKRAARSKLYTKSLTRDLKRKYSRLTLVRTSIKL